MAMPMPAATAAMPPAAPAPRPTATAAAAVARPMPAPTNAPSINIEVQFATDSAELTPAARASLDQLGRALSSPDLASYRFRIEGHTDTVGSPEHNRTLSARRADAVVSYLESNYKVARSRLEPVGLGSDQLAVPTGPQTPEPRNRRVQVVNIGA
jgi:outer membrane protein OmpA-like peptidoglycan-associated protein